MAIASPMLQDLKGTYMRRKEPSFASRSTDALEIAAACLAAIVIFLGLTWASLKYGSVPSADPSTYFPYITQVAE